MSDVELTVSVGRKEPSSVRLVGTLALAAMLSGFALAGAYQLTLPTIEANKARALRNAVFEVVPGAAHLQRLVVREGVLVAAADGEADDADEIFGAYDEGGAFLGYAVENAGAGFQDTISLLCGYDPLRNRVIGMRVLSSRETPGLGDKIYKDEAFVGNFRDLAVDPEVVLVKGGRTADHEVDAITGATISSKAVVKIVNEAVAAWRPVLPAPGSEPALERRADGDGAPAGGGGP